MLLPCGNACFEKIIRSIRSIRVRFKSVRLTSRVFRTWIIRIFTDVIALRQCLLKKINPFNPFNPCSKHSPVNVKKDRQKKYQPCFVLFLTVISTFSALFSEKYFLLNVIPPFHLTPINILIISGLYMVELWWNYGWNFM